MKRITVDTKISEVMQLQEFSALSRYFIYSPHPFGDDPQSSQMAEAPLSALQAIGWSPEGIVGGLNFLLDELKEDRVSQFPIYPDSEDPYKKDVNLIRLLPEKKDPSRPFVVLCAGGAYQSVCTMVEALPSARHMVEAGFEVYLMTYRVGIPEAAILALDDLAEAIRFLKDHAADLEIDPARYAIGGFSAGANLISNWGLTNIGWKHYGLPKPLAMFPIYTFVDLKTEAQRDENGGLLAPMFGENWRDKLDDYNVIERIDADYPPCYLVCGKDDATVPCRHSRNGR